MRRESKIVITSLTLHVASTGHGGGGYRLSDELGEKVRPARRQPEAASTRSSAEGTAGARLRSRQCRLCAPLLAALVNSLLQRSHTYCRTPRRLIPCANGQLLATAQLCGRLLRNEARTLRSSPGHIELSVQYECLFIVFKKRKRQSILIY